MQPGEELAGTQESERASKLIIAEPAEGRDALAGIGRARRLSERLGLHPQFGEELGRALAEKLSQSRFVGITRHLGLVRCFSVDGAAS
jgi:hypothetical protein